MDDKFLLVLLKVFPAFLNDATRNCSQKNGTLRGYLILSISCYHYRAKMEEYQPGSQPEPNNGLTAESLRVFQGHSD
ncbi:hypothetical protein Patl1_03577 [Pistacia atlantica]|uniref:Uncharacterized protein n=1 Tax=Pistacia atlantica TaxID=434234 RepID=A0ACC1CC89_9ROSI|nr:hypothetical protein Patl1_03577 [Pistacia atlantica]